MPEELRVEVAYAEPQVQFLHAVVLPAAATLRAAIEASGVLVAFPHIDLARVHVGIWNREAALDAPLRDGDRVEIYRPLQVDPKAVRRERAEKEPPRRAR